MNRIYRKMFARGLFAAVVIPALSMGGCGKSDAPRADASPADTRTTAARLTGIYYDRDNKQPLNIHFLAGNACKVGSDRTRPVFGGTYTIKDNILMVDLGVLKQALTIVNATTLQTTWEGKAWTLRKE